ncbi:hypothetical protein IE53DRAFT_218163 [Violaceomyces palustris]|uniref:Uncharacterized protein n=1 Tax=Violaceomyces palustris TaxID=1673888 RepID=A0ACD0NQD5_9BASI|nr:hypothetical protein IE53DRAFT_218163 [Violaceomyces palustris]
MEKGSRTTRACCLGPRLFQTQAPLDILVGLSWEMVGGVEGGRLGGEKGGESQVRVFVKQVGGFDRHLFDVGGGEESLPLCLSPSLPPSLSPPNQRPHHHPSSPSSFSIPWTRSLEFFGLLFSSHPSINPLHTESGSHPPSPSLHPLWLPKHPSPPTATPYPPTDPQRSKDDRTDTHHPTLALRE